MQNTHKILKITLIFTSYRSKHFFKKTKKQKLTNNQKIQNPKNYFHICPALK